MGKARHPDGQAYRLSTSPPSRTAALSKTFEHLSAVPLLVEALRTSLPANAVLVAPDLGAVKLAERYATALQRPVAIVHKTRISGEEEVTKTAGEDGTPRSSTRARSRRRPSIVSDTISLLRPPPSRARDPYVPRTVSTGHGARATTRAATLPRKSRASPVRPWVPTTIRFAPAAFAARMIRS